MPKAAAKFWPSSWLVPICSALPSPIIPSQVQVRVGPGEPLAGGLVPGEDGQPSTPVHGGAGRRR